MSTLNIVSTNVGGLRRQLPPEGFDRLCEAYGFHPINEDSATEVQITLEELASYGWHPADPNL